MARKTSSKARKNALGKHRIIGQLEQLAFVGHAVDVLEEAQDRAQDWANGKNQELNGAVAELRSQAKRLQKRVRGTEKDLRDDAQKRLRRFVSGVLQLPAIETLGELPERFLAELDTVLDRVGLVRKDKFAAAKSKVQRTAKRRASKAAARKPAAKKKATAKKATSKKATSKKATSKKATSKKATSKKATSKKKPVAKKRSAAAKGGKTAKKTTRKKK